MFKHRLILNEITPYFSSPEAVIITGMRRTGKTTLLNFIYGQIDSKNKLFLDLENPVNRKHFEENNYENIKRALEVLGLDFTQRTYIFCDEIQFTGNLPSIAKYFIDHYNTKFFLTGSASFYLKNLFTESLAGRKFIFELFPLTFQEFLSFKEEGLNIPAENKNLTPSIIDTLSVLYNEYILFGGFPGVVLKTNAEEKKKTLDDIFTSFFQLEVNQLGDFRKNKAIRDLMLLLMQRTGSKLHIQKISKELGISRITLSEYISFLENTYFIKTITPLSRGEGTELRKIPKVYICDTGLAGNFAKLDAGSLFENSVFQNLRLKGGINYYQRKSGVGIDFILNKEIAYEAKVKPGQGDIKKLRELSEGLGLKDYKVVSKSYSQLDNVIYGFML